MMLVAGCPLPDMASLPFFENLLYRLSNTFGNALSQEQLNHIAAFGDSGAARHARAGRVMARLLALSQLPQNAKINMDQACKPVVEPRGNIGFSHSPQASFCLLTSNNDAHNSIAIDVEYIFTPFSADACIKFLRGQKIMDADLANVVSKWRALRLWTNYEAVLKTGNAHDMAQICGLNAKRSGHILVNGQKVYWRSFTFMSHMLCVAQKAKPIGRLEFSWHNPWNLYGILLERLDHAAKHAPGETQRIE